MTCGCPSALALLSRGLPAGHHWIRCKRCDEAGTEWEWRDPECEAP